MAVFVLDKKGKPWTPCSEKRARQPLERGRARGGRTKYNRQRTRRSAGGSPRGYLMRGKSVFGFQTGDLACAQATAGENQGRYVGRVRVRASGRFNIQTSAGVVQGISHRRSRLLERGDGCAYSRVTQHSGKERENRGAARHRALSLPGLKAGISRAMSR